MRVMQIVLPDAHLGASVGSVAQIVPPTTLEIGAGGSISLVAHIRDSVETLPLRTRLLLWCHARSTRGSQALTFSAAHVRRDFEEAHQTLGGVIHEFRVDIGERRRPPRFVRQLSVLLPHCGACSASPGKDGAARRR